ncbi:hypothetical protein LTR84_005672 [Exophiala bonariae]|uniref:Xylanolytic transcriptional activator regulatory domain-containing protein n=1 Tax=Exophiala bonariae TaxID=1690606 RepID=A0AAV9N2Y5_9EURO|nr:hypothetical protein LTR84_005672 [Exophiala bonariae]
MLELPHWRLAMQRKRKRYTLSPSPPGEYSASQSPYKPELFQVSQASNRQPTPSNDQSEYIKPSFDENEFLPAEQHANQTVHEENAPGGAESYIGRDAYLDGSIPATETTNNTTQQAHSGLSDIDMQVLHLYKAFDMPPRSVRNSLIDKFMEHCLPWMPIVDRRWLEEQPDHFPSPLLLQSVFLAGSRVSAKSLIGATSEDYYQRAKVLFFSGHERNPLISVVSALLLHWWNPTGPEQISASSSGFWVRIAAGLAYQIGLHKEPIAARDKALHRRIWWTLVWRDDVISVGVGRPRTISLKDSNVLPPTIKDFPAGSPDAKLFTSFCHICQLLGDITQYRRRKSFTASKRQKFENALYRWIKELPSELRLFKPTTPTTSTTAHINSLAPYSFKNRQVAIVYFVILIILHRRDEPSTPSSTPSLLASSFISSIFEEFLSRDELRYLGPVFAFYALAAGLAQMSGYRYAALEAAAEHEFNVISMCLASLSDRWGSAAEAMRSLQAARKAAMRLPKLQREPAGVEDDVYPYFNDFGPDLCRQWHLLGKTAVKSAESDGAASTSQMQQQQQQQVGKGQQHVVLEPASHAQVDAGLNVTGNSEEFVDGDFLALSQPQQSMSLDQQDPMLYPGLDSLFPDQQFDYPWSDLDPVGSWLLGDLGLDSSLGPNT